MTELTLDGSDLAEFERSVAIMSPVRQLAERLRLHLMLGGLVTEGVVRSCALSSRVDLRSWRWLESTADLQSNTYGYDLKDLETHVDKLAAYVQWNLLAIYQETGELGVEFSWAPWATDEPFVNRDRVLAEIVDVKHFLGNILVAMGVTDEEFEAAYQAKQDKNRRRQASGTYSKRKGSLGQGSEVE